MQGSAAHTAAPGGSEGHGASHASVRDYVIGFALSIILTAVPFGLVMAGTIPASTAVPICLALAVVQIVVHLVYFLHMNRASSRSWNMAALIFTVVVVAILGAGTIWVMYHLNLNMMPGMMPNDAT